VSDTRRVAVEDMAAAAAGLLPETQVVAAPADPMAVLSAVSAPVTGSAPRLYLGQRGKQPAHNIPAETRAW